MHVIPQLVYTVFQWNHYPRASHFSFQYITKTFLLIGFLILLCAIKLFVRYLSWLEEIARYSLSIVFIAGTSISTLLLIG